jgi:hypothetical protein
VIGICRIRIFTFWYFNLLNTLFPMEQTLHTVQHRFRSYLAALILLVALPAMVQAAITVNVTGTNVSCYGGNNGTATAIASGGWAPYTYQWSNGATTQTITGLAAGVYHVTVTDIDLAFAIGTITITQPNALGVTVYAQGQICGIVPDGTATAVPYGGVGPYTYLWSNGGTTSQITGLSTGTYVVTVTDANNCTAVGSTFVNFANEGLWVMDSTVDVTCFGANDGFAYISPMSGTAPYTYQWSNGQTGPNLSNLGPGTYTVTITDAFGCFALHNVIITQPTALNATVSTTPGVCGLAGSATITITGGTPPYAVLWQGTSSTNFTVNLTPGSYGVTVTDANECTKTTTFNVSGTPNSLNIAPAVLSNAGCTIGGSASASVSGGSGNYAYTWSSNPAQTTQTANNLAAGNYTVTVVDITTGCTKTATINVPAAPTLTGTATLLTNANCLVGGSATANPSGGTAPYTYQWDTNGPTTQTASNLSAGPHSVKITDAKGCIVIAIVNIGQAQGPTVTAIANNNAGCNQNNGSATATATAGSGGYLYLWSANANNATSATVNNLGAGTYTVTVTDAGGCSATATVTISQTGGPSAVISASSGAGCTSGGSATAAASGGTGPYTYKWSTNPQQTTATVTNLGPGSYTVTVTDVNGCTATAVVSIAAALQPNVVITASANATCDQPGSATAAASGGAGPYTYKWNTNPQQTTATASLFAGSYTVTVTDANGCTATASVTIGSTTNGVQIGDYVWYDNDQDGFQHPLETAGVAGVSVMLIKAGPDNIFGTSDDVTANTTTTNASGIYNFGCVPPGTYILMFSGIPAGYVWTGKDQVNNDCLDSDVKANGKTDPFTIVSGQANNFCFDAGISIPCDNVLNAGIVCCDQTVCEGQTPAPLTPVQAPSGGTGPYEYQWLQQVATGSNTNTWVAVPGATASSYQPGPMFETTRFMRCARGANCVTFLESNIVTITVVPAGTPGCEDAIYDMVVQASGLTAVEIRWSTQPEGAQFLYTVQHSVNNTQWENIATLMGKQDASAPNHYEVTDQTPVSGKNFYRVKRTSQSGVVIYSQVLEIDMDITPETSITIYPNPASSQLFVKNMMEYEADVQIQITTTKGEVIHTNKIEKGVLQQLEIPLEDVPQGLYLVKIRFGNGDTKTLKITKF